MFYPVRILDARGHVKKVVSSKQLSRDYWREFDKMLEREFAGKRKKSRRPPSPDGQWVDEESLETD